MAKSKSPRKEKTKLQTIYGAPRKELVGSYVTAKGKRLLAAGEITQEDVDARYTKNRYRMNPMARVVKVIEHQNFHTTK